MTALRKCLSSVRSSVRNRGAAMTALRKCLSRVFRFSQRRGDDSTPKEPEPFPQSETGL